MARPPRDPRRPLLDALAVFGVLAGGLSLAAAVAAAYLWVSHHGASLEAARTAAFSTWMIGHIVLAAHMRAERQPLLAGGFVVTRPFLVWSLTAILLAGLGPFVPVLAQRLSLTPLNANQWAVVLMCALLFPSWIEVAKWRNRRNTRRPAVRQSA